MTANKNADLLAQLVQTYAPSGHEEPVARVLTAYFAQHGIEVERDELGNVIVELGSGEPALLLSSHMDTIPGELPFEVTATHIAGRGAVDCRPALAAMAEATVYFKEHLLDTQPGRLTFAGIVREETSLEGMQTYFAGHPAPSFAIFGEPTRANRVCIAYKGRLWVEVTVQAESGHVAAVWDFPNPIDVLITIYERIKIHCQQIKGATPFYQVHPVITTLHGGQTTNTIPAQCRGDIDIRFPPNVAVEGLQEAITEIVETTREETGVSITRTFNSVVPGYRTQTSAPAIRQLQAAIENVTGNPGRLLKKTGTCFMNLIGAHYHVPTVTYGAGDPRLEHTSAERVEIAEYLQTVRVYEHFLAGFFNPGTA